MAEIAVNLVIDKLAPLLAGELKLLSGVRKEVIAIKDELESIQSFLRDADGKAEINNSTKTWVKQVREVAFRIEDVIDEYILHSFECAHQRKFLAFLQKAVCCIRDLKRHHDIANEIQDIKTTICLAKERSETYGFISLGQGSISSVVNNVAWDNYPRLASQFIEDAEVVGIEKPKQQLISWLLGGESKRTAFSVVGMGGLGKTTLAKKVFDSPEVKGHFHCNAWIAVSQSYKVEEILRTMIKKFYESMKEESALGGINTREELEDVQLIEKLREYLQEKKYLVVFDDVWAIDFWGLVQLALPCNEKGSRIIVTTRSHDVASSCVESSTDHVFELQPLPPEQAWELFCWKVFKTSNCPEELKGLSFAIVKKCQGMPLAIVVIGGLLSKKAKDAFRWQLFHDSLRSELESNPHLTSITKILSFSYHDLPYYLKSCFLYFGIFPEDYSIRCGRLIRLWIAEGFVKETNGKTLEDVAEEYLNELVQRSLVQISWFDHIGRARECQVHDLMREIILSKYDELNFCRVLAEKKDINFDGSVRRLSLHNYEENVPKSSNFSKVRSIFLFEVNDLPKQLTDSLFTDYSLLKVLDFEDACLGSVPEEVGNLLHLRYFSLRKTEVRILPKSIGKLQNLETLDLKQSLVNELPIGILRLHKLRHLLAYCDNDEIDYCAESRRGVKMPEGIGSLEALQKLSYVEAGHGDHLLKDLEKLRQLRRLGITRLKRENGMALGAAIEKMNHLLSLDLITINDEEIIDVQLVSSPPSLLQRLFLGGRLEKFPNWISKLYSLTKLYLNFSRLSDDPLSTLQTLPNLLELSLFQGYDGEQLHFEAGGFKKLKTLKLQLLEKLSLVMIDQGALPVLEEVGIGPKSPQLKEVPLGIQHLESLTVLRFWDMPTEFELRLQPDGGLDYWKIKHIPTVLLLHKLQGYYYQAFTLPEYFSKYGKDDDGSKDDDDEQDDDDDDEDGDGPLITTI